MIPLARRASLVIVLLLLASVGTASAECAWVLWSEFLPDPTMKDPSPKTIWTIFAAYSQEEGGSRACRIEKDRQMDRVEQTRQKWLKRDVPPPISCGPNCRIEASK